MKLHQLILIALFLTQSLVSGLAGVEEDWAAVAAMDAGPKKKPANREEAILLARNHFLAHRKAIEVFLSKYPQDPRAFDARLRLASIFATEGKMDNDPKKVQNAMLLFETLEKTPGISTDKQADAGFHRISLYMQSQKANVSRTRQDIVEATKEYVTRYPGDRRGPRLLVEAATICDDSPKQKRLLLDQALSLTSEEALKARIADDMKRLDMLDKPLELTLSPLKGGTLDLRSLRGNVVVVIFWSVDSPPSLLWMRDFHAAYDKLTNPQLRVVTVNLDTDRKLVEQSVGQFQIGWPVHFDGKGWESPLARSLGINTLPTVWILDKKGVLRTLNARTSYESWIRQLLRE